MARHVQSVLQRTRTMMPTTQVRLMTSQCAVVASLRHTSARLAENPQEENVLRAKAREENVARVVLHVTSVALHAKTAATTVLPHANVVTTVVLHVVSVAMTASLHAKAVNAAMSVVPHARTAREARILQVAVNHLNVKVEKANARLHTRTVSNHCVAERVRETMNNKKENKYIL